MDNLFLLLFLASFVCLIIGLIKPTVFSRFIKGEITRKKIGLIFGIATVAFFVIFGITTDTNKQTQSNTNEKVAEQKTEPKQLSPEEQEKKAEAEAAAKKIADEERAKKEAEEKALQEALSKPHFGDGNHIVGTDIQPGTYRTRKASSGCYYSRLSGFGGSLGEIISNENTDAPAVITIAATDKGFKSTRCGTWTQDLSAITSDQTTFGDGIFIIGTYIQAGTYKSSGSDSCYYSRLRGFSGSLGDIISNENTDSSAVVTIASSDKGFKSTRCGTWTKLK